MQIHKNQLFSPNRQKKNIKGSWIHPCREEQDKNHTKTNIINIYKNTENMIT